MILKEDLFPSEKSETEEMPQKETYSTKKSKSESSPLKRRFSDFKRVSITIG
jgi:hypothetical protein